MSKTVFNPYLPFWETIPDGEPRIFGDRLYVYGSHDSLRGTYFCTEDYVCWSCTVDDLSDWKYEGVIYSMFQDPINGAKYDKPMPEYKGNPFTDEPLYLYAPDVIQGPDGRYYMYYALDVATIMSVAVSDSPAGPFEFLDYVLYPDGTRPEVGHLFDPGLYCDETGIYMYYGFAPEMKFGELFEKDRVMDGAYMVRLADDMHTVISSPVRVAEGVNVAKGTSFEAHPFFEASSLRKIRDKYYFIYSSLQGHELCYATADSPEGPFEFGGVLVSNGDIGYNGNKLATNYMGNNHGSIAEIGGKYYIFWHRHTHGTAFSRQGCADQIQILPDGSIPQTEITSCGLNNGPIPAKGHYSTYIACHVTGPDRETVERVTMAFPGMGKEPYPEDMPFITEEPCRGVEMNMKPFIYNLKAGAIAGVKYHEFDGTESSISLELRGVGVMSVSIDSPEGPVVAEVSCKTGHWLTRGADLKKVEGLHALYFTVKEGCFDFASYEII